MTFLLAIAAAAIAGALTWTLGRQRHAALATQLALHEADSVRLGNDLANAQEQCEALAAQLASAKEALAAQQAQAQSQLAAATEKVADREATARRYLEDINALRATMKTEFEAAAAKILEEKSKSFSSRNQEQLGNLLNPLRERLSEFRNRIDHIYKTEGEDRATLKAQIEALRTLNSSIGAEAQALTHALKGQSQVRGAWGELVLERLLDSAGLIKGENYLVQNSFTNAEGRVLRPDVILLLPEGRHLVIDSKVSLVAYERAVNATDEAARSAAAKEHAQAVRQHIDELSNKAYDDSGKLFTPDYVLMFVPLEPAYALALQRNPGLYDYAFGKRVILLTAPSLLGTLKTIAALWNQDRQNKNVTAITDQAAKLHEKFAGLLQDLEKAGKALDAARGSYDAAMSKLYSGNGNLHSQVAKLEKLGAKPKHSLPPPPEAYQDELAEAAPPENADSDE